MAAFLSSAVMLAPLALAVLFTPVGTAINCGTGDTDVWLPFDATITVLFLESVS